MREHDLAEFELERDGLKVRVRKARPAGGRRARGDDAGRDARGPGRPDGRRARAGRGGTSGVVPADAAEGVDLAVIKSPIVGTFYRASEPGAPPFVEVGDTVKKGQVLCIIEAMKLMNEIESDCDGEIVGRLRRERQAGAVRRPAVCGKGRAEMGREP